MATISLHVITRICTKPNLLAEICRLLSFTRAAFLGHNLLSALPSLVASSNRDALEALSKDVGVPVKKLIAVNGEHVMAHILLLESPTALKSALSYLSEVLQAEAAEAGGDGALTLIRTCLAKLFAELAKILGDDDPTRMQRVRF